MSDRSAPTLEIVVKKMTEPEIWRLYADADLFVSPSWGESFGLALLEAMASGIPAVTTGWGGSLDFVADGPDLLSFELKEAESSIYETVPGAKVAIPDVEELAERLRWHFEHREESRAAGSRARQNVRNLTWKRSAPPPSS